MAEKLEDRNLLSAVSNDRNISCFDLYTVGMLVQFPTFEVGVFDQLSTHLACDNAM